MTPSTDPVRRLLAAVALGALAACSSAAGGDDGVDPVPTVGFLRSVPNADLDSYLDELRAQGWVPGRTVRIEPAEGEVTFGTEAEARAALEAWEQEGLAVVVAFSTPYARLAEEVTDLPGLFVVNDPVGSGLVGDPTRPDGQLTGVAWDTPADLTLDLAAQVLGSLRRVGYLLAMDDPAVPGHRDRVVEAASHLGIEVVDATFTGPADVADAVAELAAAQVDAVFVPSANAVIPVLGPLEEALDGAGLPALSNAQFIDIAVVTLTPDAQELNRQLARQTTRLLSGVPVSSVPTETPRRFKVTIDRTRARALGIEIDPSVLRQADVVR